MKAAAVVADLSWITSNSSQVWNCDGAIFTRFCHAQDFDGSQIPVTTERFELQTSPMECSYIVSQTKSTLRLSGLGNCIACKMFTVQIFL